MVKYVTDAVDSIAVGDTAYAFPMMQYPPAYLTARGTSHTQVKKKKKIIVSSSISLLYSAFNMMKRFRCTKDRVGIGGRIKVESAY
jgi:hypothetical protein